MATISNKISEDDLHELYLWVDSIPLSRPKRNIARDFSDGCCIAEIVKHFFPKLVELHNYTPANSVEQKKQNWVTLNNRVFRKLHFEVPAAEVRDITGAVPGAIERFLRALQTKITQIQQKQAQLEQLPPEQQMQYQQQQQQQRYAQQQQQQRPGSGLRPIPTSGGSLHDQLQEKDMIIDELRETVSILGEKVAKYEEIVQTKDRKIQALQQRLQQLQQ